jgi:hypothetical protein
MLRRRLSLLAPSLALLAALLVVSSALAGVRIGTSGNDILTGTAGVDQLTGKGGDDVLKGLAGNDTYFFADNFSNTGSGGFDTLVETSKGGIDTVNFRGVRSGAVFVIVVREWATEGFNYATGPGGRVSFSYTNTGTTAQSYVENAVGGALGDSLFGGGGPNVLQPGGGDYDVLRDYGGWKDEGGFPDIPASNDTYKGFAHNTGSDEISDWGGTGDVLDMRPFSTEDVYLDTVNMGGPDAAEESLQIVTGATSQVLVLGQFSPYWNGQTNGNPQGRIEKLIFADATITDIQTLQTAAAASARAGSGPQGELADVAPRLAEEARKQIDPRDPTGAKVIQGGNDPGAEVGPKPGKDTTAEKDKKAKKAKKAKHDKNAKAGKRDGLQRQSERRGQGGSR